MQKKILLIVFILFIVNANLFAQKVELGFQTGYGFYNMSSIRNITNETFAQLPFEAKIISNCPPFLYYQPRIAIPKAKMKYGLIYTYQSTGSRVSSKDYSGEYKFDARIYSHSPGAFINIYRHKGTIIFGLFSEVGVNFNTLKLNEYVKIDTIANNQEYTFTSTSYYVKPGVNFIYPWNKYSMELNVGLYKEFLKGDLSNGESYIPVKTNILDSDMWDGLRIGLIFSYNLTK